MQNTWKKNTIIFLLSQSISIFGSSLVQYAITWHITLTTQSGQYTMLTILCSFLPTFFISPFAGVWADRYNRKTLIMLADAGIALCTLALAITFMMGYDMIWLMLVAAGLRGLGSAIQSPCVNAMIPDIVPKEKLTRINGINMSLQSAIMLVSPMFAGVLMSFADIEHLFFIDVITAALAIFVMFTFLKLPEKRKADGLENVHAFDKPFDPDNVHAFDNSNDPNNVHALERSYDSNNMHAFDNSNDPNNVHVLDHPQNSNTVYSEDNSHNPDEVYAMDNAHNQDNSDDSKGAKGIDFIADMKSGLRYIREHRFLKRYFVYSSIFMIVISPAAFLTPLQVTRTFGVEIWRLTAVELTFSIGMTIGGILISIWGGFSNRVKTMALGCGVMGITTFVMGLPFEFWIYLSAMCVCGMSVPVFNTPAIVMLQEKVEPEFMGRVFSISTTISTSLMPLAMLLFGPLADIVRIEYLLIATGAIMALVTAVLLFDRELRPYGMPSPATPEK